MSDSEMEAASGRRVQFWRNSKRWSPSIEVLDLILAVLRIDSWSERPENWAPYSWRSLHAAMVADLQKGDGSPLLPGGFHARYSRALAELQELSISVRGSGGEWSDREPLCSVYRSAWTGSGASKGQRIEGFSFANIFTSALVDARNAVLNLRSYFGLPSAHWRLGFIVLSAAAAHREVTYATPVVRTGSFVFAAAGYAQGSICAPAWAYRLAVRMADALRGATLGTGAKLGVTVCASIHDCAEPVTFHVWSDKSLQQRENISPTEARARSLLGDAEVQRRLAGDDLYDHEITVLNQVYSRAGVAGIGRFARDRAHWSLLARLFGETFRPELEYQLKSLLEESSTSPTSDHKRDLVPKDLVRVGVFRVRRRLFMALAMPPAPAKSA